MNYLAGGVLQQVGRSFHCDPEQEEILGCHMEGTVMCFRSDEEDMKIPRSVADSSGCHIPSKSGSGLGQRNCSR